jgi:hypothetical protein
MDVTRHPAGPTCGTSQIPQPLALPCHTFGWESGSPRAYPNLAVGAHQFRVRATDPAENVDGAPARHSWTITQECSGSTVALGAAADGWILQSSGGQNHGTS